MGAGTGFRVIVVGLMLFAGALPVRAVSPAKPPLIHVPIGQLLTVPVGNLANPNELSKLRDVYWSRCKRQLQVTDRREASNLPVDAVIAQDPKAGGVVSCFGGVTLTRSSGPVPIEPPVKSAVPWLMPLLNDKPGVSQFQQETLKRCDGQARRILFREGLSDVPQGAIYDQYPKRDVPITCATPVFVFYSSGLQPFPIGDLSNSDLRTRFERRASAFCGAPQRISIATKTVGGPVGSFIIQSPGSETTYSCGLPVTVTLSAPPTPSPWLMPDIMGEGGRAELRSETQNRCGRRAVISTRSIKSDELRGTPIAQTPEAGSFIACATRISISVSSGPPPGPPPCGDDTRPLTERLFTSDACHPALIQPWQAVLGLLAGLAGVVAVVRWANPKPPEPFPDQTPIPPSGIAPAILQGVVTAECSVAYGSLDSLVPDIAVDFRTGDARVELMTPLVFMSGEDDHA